MTPDVRVCADAGDLSQRAAQAVAGVIVDAVAAAGRCSLLLSGGTTPRALYGVLASRFGDRIPWGDVHVFWGDERYVPSDDPQSNYRMAKETLLDHVPCPAANVHPMPTHFADPEAAARDYEATLRREFAGEWPRFDLVLLGLGPDGHTASLFPGSPALDEQVRWVRAVTVPAIPTLRLTITLPVFARSANTYFLVVWSAKADALSRVLARSVDPKMCPAAAIKPTGGALVWWIDSTAARELNR